jgi:hypothetical protein
MARPKSLRGYSFKLTSDKLTSASIKLNGRVSLRRRENQLIAILEAPNSLFRAYCLNLATIGSDNQSKPQGRAKAVVLKRRVPLKPKTVIGMSARRLTLQYAELLHLRKAVREAELLAGNPNETQRPNFKVRISSPEARIDIRKDRAAVFRQSSD